MTAGPTMCHTADVLFQYARMWLGKMFRIVCAGEQAEVDAEHPLEVERIPARIEEPRS